MTDETTKEPTHRNEGWGDNDPLAAFKEEASSLFDFLIDVGAANRLVPYVAMFNGEICASICANIDIGDGRTRLVPIGMLFTTTMHHRTGPNTIYDDANINITVDGNEPIDAPMNETVLAAASHIEDLMKTFPEIYKGIDTDAINTLIKRLRRLAGEGLVQHKDGTNSAISTVSVMKSIYGEQEPDDENEGD